MAKTKAVSAKSVIELGIEAGKSVNFILSQVAKKCPDSKADASHVRFYANALVKAGKLKPEVAESKYGCGKRGRKAAKASTEVKKEAKKPAAKKAPAKKTVKDPVKKKAAPASKKSAKSEKAKTTKKPKTSSKS